MTPRPALVASAFLLSALTLAVACSSQNAKKKSAMTDVAPDTLVGIVAITGTVVEKRVVLRSGSRSSGLSASAADSAALSRLGGVEVVVRGQAGGSVFRVASFTAQRVDGAPVADGVLRSDGERLVLETTGGRIALGNPPAAFRAMVGARVWVSGPLDTGPNMYGVIVPRP